MLPQIPGIGEGAQLQVQMSAFNLFNNLNLTNINSTIANPTITNGVVTGWTNNAQFGQAFGALGARTAEVQFKFVF
jgi:hypothetical protein